MGFVGCAGCIPPYLAIYPPTHTYIHIQIWQHALVPTCRKFLFSTSKMDVAAVTKGWPVTAAAMVANLRRAIGKSNRQEAAAIYTRCTRSVARRHRQPNDFNGTQLRTW